MINNVFSNALKEKIIKNAMPFAECGSMSQGYIGYHIQNAINTELNKRNIKGKVVSLITQTIVDKNSTAFKNPTKPVGNFYDEKEAKFLAKENNWIVKEDAGRGWRRVVPSPKPIDIVEKDIIKILSDNNVILIAGGGGGIPVYKEGDSLVGVDAVIDKDFTSAKIAELVKADVFMILTAINKVIINFGKPEAKEIDEIEWNELKKLSNSGHFPAGSMRPKVEAALNFTNNTGKKSYISDLSLVDKVLDGKAGTKIYKK